MTAALEDVKTFEIEEWGTLNTAASPTRIPKGQTPNALNVWVDEKPGSVVTAKGYRLVGRTPSNLPSPFCINFFNASAGTQQFVVSDGATVWSTIDFQTFTVIATGFNNGFQLRGLVIRDKLWLTNGSDPVRVWDGVTLTSLDGNSGRPNVPRGRFIAYFDERVWLYHTTSNRSGVYFSSLIDPAGTLVAPDLLGAWPSGGDNELKISDGDADFGTAIAYFRNTLHFFKQYAIYRLVGYDEYTYSRVKTRSSVGTRFAESIGILDNFLHFIGTDGLYVFNGEDSERISDIIDPATASQTAFGFNQLQQPNSASLFWTTTDSADWNEGGVPANLVVADAITLIAADDSAANFTAGVTKTNIVVRDSGEIKLSYAAAGVAPLNVALTGTPVLTPTAQVDTVGAASYINDGSLSNPVGFRVTATSNPLFSFGVTFSEPVKVSRIVLRGYISTSNFWRIRISVGNSQVVPSSLSVTNPVGGAGWSIQTGAEAGDIFAGLSTVSDPSDITFNFSGLSEQSSIRLDFNRRSNVGLFPTTLKEIEVYATSFEATGKFVSKALDLSQAPASVGTFNAEAAVPSGSSVDYFTQSSADGIAWDSEVPCNDEGPITSVARRYLRWGANLTSNGNVTPIISSAWLPSIYLSKVHNTGGNIFVWGPFEANYKPSAQVVKFYYRSGTSPAAVSAASWNEIPSGAVPAALVSHAFIQFKVEILSGDATHLASVSDVTFNWVFGSGSQQQTLQNVASTIWRNRYWLSAAGPDASRNDTILIRGKKPYKYPWQLKDWPLLSFSRFQDNLYGCSSLDGAIYRLDVGYSKDNAAMDSHFETGDLVVGGFYIAVSEVLLEVERTGPYELSVGVSVNRGNTWTEYPVDLTVSDYAPSYFKRLNVSASGDQVRFRVKKVATDQPFEVHRFTAFYTLTPSRGSLR